MSGHHGGRQAGGGGTGKAAGPRREIYSELITSAKLAES